MDEHDWLAEQFEANRAHLRAVAHRMLGSLSEADDAVQESWLHLSRSDTSGVLNLGGWLTTVVARICLDMLRSRNSRREESLEASQPVEKVLNKLIRKEDDTAFSSLRNSTNWQERKLSSKKGMNTWPKDTQKEAHLASDGNGCRPHPRFLSSRFRFCPEAITNASQLTLQSRRKRNRRIPCHSFASPNKGSTHTFRLRRAFWYASV